MVKKAKIFESLEMLAEIIPANVYWFDVNNVVLGLNERTVKAVGGSSHADFIGKTPYEFYSQEIATSMVEHHKKVVETGESFSQEEVIRDLTTGRIRYFNAIITPLFGDKGEIVGSVAIAAETTAEKNIERLQLENNLQQTKIADQETFRKDVGQLIHDINTPLSTIQIILEMIKDTIPESERITLRSAVGSIKGMTGNLLSKYKKDKDENQNPEPTLISLLLTQVLEEKKIQSANANTPIEFNYNFNDNDFAFININQLAIKRSITNLLNNSVEAMDKTKPGTIQLDLSKKDNLIAITIKDNGKGMPPEILDKLKNHIAVTNGKTNGHGIGFVQIYETVKNNNGTIEITSIPNQGTTITLSFPAISPPSWLAQELHFNPKDTIVILDDDSSIHGAWDLIFKKYQSIITLKHFTQGSEAIAFINSFPNKNQIFLLSDFELLNQNLNGMDVIKQTNVRAVLVTSHYTDKKILQLIQDNNIKLLPKQLASEAIVIIDNFITKEEIKGITKAGIVIIDDAKIYTNQISSYLTKECNLQVGKYYNSEVFLGELAEHISTNTLANFYPKTTKFFIGNYFKNTTYDGLVVAKALRDAGFTKLYLLSGQASIAGAPEYLTVILKSDIDEIVKYATIF